MKKTLKFALVISIVFSLLIGNMSALAVNIINETPDNQNKTVTTETNTAQSNEDNEITVENNTSTDNNPETSEKPNGKDEAESESKEGNNTILDTESSIFDDEKSEGIVDQILKNLMTATENDETPKAGEDDVATESFGKLYVSVDLRLPQANQNKLATSIFNVILKKDNTEYKPEFYKGSSQVKEETKLYYTFNNVKAGTYILEISGKGYAPYTHEVVISGNTISELSLTNGYKENALDILEGNQIGVLAIGDVTSDGYIVGYNLDGTVPNGQHANDEEKMIGVLDKGTKDSSCDLNGDGKVDIIDLSYISINKNKERTAGKILESVDISSADVKVTETTKIEQGEVDYILQNNDKYITLAPKDPNANISEENAIEITLDLGQNVQPETQEITIAPSSNPENNIEGGTITIELDSGETIQAVIDKTEIAKVASYGANIFRPIATVNAKIEPDGTISVDLGKKVAVKKVTIKVTATKSNKFADIAKVEFLNGNIDRVPAPELAIPKITDVDASTGQSFTVTWENMVNVTGYEVKIRAMTKNSGEQTEIYSVDGNSITISDFHGAIEDNIPATYYVSVQSVNGEWRSGFSDETAVTVDAVSKPGAPDNLTLKGGVKKIEASWKKMNATDSYRVYYRKYDEGDYVEATAGITLKEPRFTIENLEDAQRYQVYVIGVNRIGDSDRSNVAVAETSNITPAQMPNYKLINTPNGKGELTDHIVNAIEKGIGEMRESPLDTDSNGAITSNSAKGTVDNDYDSYLYVPDWDFGGHYPDVNNKGVQVTFDQPYKMYYFTFAQIENLDTFSKVQIHYKDMDTNKMVGPIEAAQVTTKKDANGRHYYVAKLAQPITSDTVQISVGRPYSYVNKITIAELRFYEYDSLEHDIYNLYEDQMHTTLKSSVTQKTLDDLQDRLNTKDQVSDEYNPEKESLEKELELARTLLNNTGLNNVVKIDTTVTKSKDGHITFRGGLNAWQPLGVVASSNKTIKVYVGNPNKQSGDATDLDLILTQYYPEAAKWHNVVRTSLKVGLNEITLPKIDDLDKESGGSLYIEYKGNNPNDIYGVRVDGGEEIPVLDLSKIDRKDYSDESAFEQARKDAVKAYVTKLVEVVPKLPELHAKHQSKDVDELDYEYNERNCILGATEIVLDQMMYSVSSQQILEGLNDRTSIEDKSEKLYNSLVAMEDMVDLFYSHKGLNKDPEVRDGNSYPSSRLNIRYHKMFAGAAMYAGGLHIGIDWGDVPTLSRGVPIQTTSQAGKDGKYVSGNYFGWGIAHEIGHIINESAYVHAEVTNNYFSVLSQAQDTNESVRFKYPEVYKKVMSGKTGKAQNVFTQLGLYWQLHLAYDKGGYNFKTYDDYKEQQENLIFARMDSYARTPSLAPKAEDGGIGLTLSNSGNTDDKDNNLMRLACAAAKKDILDFFRKWGMTPNEDTIRYASQWEKEDRAIYFVNDEARAYELAGGQKMSEGTKVEAEAEIVKDQDQNSTNQVKLTIHNTNSHSGAMLGYEIVRTYMDNADEITIPVAFVTADDAGDGDVTYVDTIETFNNRVFTYKITGYDKYLEATKQLVLKPIKVEHDGTIGGKADWTVTTNLISDDDEDVTAKDSDDVDVSDGAQTVKAVSKLVDNNYEVEYKGKTENEAHAQITIELEEAKKIVGFKYTSKENLQDYTVEVNKTGADSDWTTVKTIEEASKENLIDKIAKVLKINNAETKLVYFGEDDRLDMYDASYVRITINKTNVSLNEIDLIGQTGDNVDFIKAGDGTYSGYGKLKNDVTLGESDESHEDVKIPAGSIVFTGTYKGNPAYNALKLWDENNDLLAGSAQTFYAEPLPEGALLSDVTDGVWIYWLEPKIWVDADGNQVDEGTEGATEEDNPMYTKFSTPQADTSVRAELYRVDDANDLTGERIVSDTYRIPITTLPEITIESNGVVNDAN